MDTEGTFTLHAVVGLASANPRQWESIGFVHARDEGSYLECVQAGSTYETREVALFAAIEAARAVARTLDPEDSVENRRRPGG